MSTEAEFEQYIL